MIEETSVQGFYKIPNFSRYGLSKMGDVINLLTLKILKPINYFKGYIRFTLVHDSGERLSMSRHRLLGIVFIPCPGNPEEMLINHKNLIPGDDRLDNLEWCTHAENMVHAKENEARRGKILVERRDPNTLEIVLYENRVECAKASGLAIAQLLWRLESGPERVYPEGFQYRIYGDTRHWGDGSECEFGRNKEIQVKECLSGKIFDFSSQREAATFLEVSEGGLSVWLNDPSQPVIFGLMQVKYSKQNWREVEDPFLDYEKFSKRKAVVAIDDTSLIAHIYAYANLCVAHLDLTPTLLNYRLSTKGQRVFSDGMRYLYYGDFLNSKWSAIERNPIVNSP